MSQKPFVWPIGLHTWVLPCSPPPSPHPPQYSDHMSSQTQNNHPTTCHTHKPKPRHTHTHGGKEACTLTHRDRDKRAQTHPALHRHNQTPTCSYTSRHQHTPHTQIHLSMDDSSALRVRLMAPSPTAPPQHASDFLCRVTICDSFILFVYMLHMFPQPLPRLSRPGGLGHFSFVHHCIFSTQHTGGAQAQ